MNQYSFDIKLLEEKIIFEKESTFENFISQFQIFCSKILCVINGNSLQFYDKTEDIPKNIRFDYKKRRGKITEYYFKDNNTNAVYCVFGRDSAKIFFPNIDDVDSPGITENVSSNIFNFYKEEKLKNSEKDIIPSSIIIIIDEGKEFKFNNPNYPLEIISK